MANEKKWHRKSRILQYDVAETGHGLERSHVCLENPEHPPLSRTTYAPDWLRPETLIISGMTR